jgi:putative transposase
MPRIARIVVPGIPHHVTQRGNRRLRTFFGKTDFLWYLSLLSEWSRFWSVEIWAYCLMTNHVHLIAVPENEAGLWRAIAETHRRYTIRINSRKRWRGYLWQGRFSSCPMDEVHLLRSARYIERNPVEAGIVDDPADYPWSSARAHLTGTDDPLVRAQPLLERVGNWREFIEEPMSERDLKDWQRHERSGRPIGSEAFIKELELRTGRVLLPQRSGRPPLERAGK